jgi:hypothetical protein
MYRIDAGDADALGLEVPAAADAQKQRGPLTEQLVLDSI